MKTQVPETIAAYIQTINNQDAAAFMALFSDNSVVNDVGREFRGFAAIKEWSEREIFAVQVSLEVVDAVVHDTKTLLTAKVAGNFDRTGLPDPLFLEHEIILEGDQISSLSCRLAAEKQSE